MVDHNRLTELGLAGPQVPYDASLGLPVDLQGSLTEAAQLHRVDGLVNAGMPADQAAEAFGMTVDYYHVTREAIDALNIAHVAMPVPESIDITKIQ